MEAVPAPSQSAASLAAASVAATILPAAPAAAVLFAVGTQCFIAAQVGRVDGEVCLVTSPAPGAGPLVPGSVRCGPVCSFLIFTVISTCWLAAVAFLPRRVTRCLPC